MKNSIIRFSETGVLKPLMKKYLSHDIALTEFIRDFPSEKAFEKQIEIRRKEPVNRKLLINVLRKQYQGIVISEKTKGHIESLKSENTFTVITGHQPCLFTGPLYVVIKILNTIKLAARLKGLYPESDFVPVYWMGAEDHDFEEVNHFRLFQKTLSWNSGQKGAVGRFNTKGLDEVYAQLNEILGESELSNELRDLFREAYLETDNYGRATRVLINALFGNRGLVIVDGDTPEFKLPFKKIAERELRDQITYKKVSQTNAELSSLGKIQVNPRELNLFYLDKNRRDRIIVTADGFKIDKRPENYSLKQMLALLEEFPERFSPNVLLRPLYQEILLPNLAYVGGLGELAYWLELKSLFAEFNYSLPLLIARNSFVFVNENQSKKMKNLGVELIDFFGDNETLTRKIVETHDDELSFDKENNSISIVLNQLKEKAIGIDPSLKQVFEGEKQRILKSIDNLEKRAFRAMKQKNEQKIKQVLNIKERLFPGGGLQERIDNFSGFYQQQGEALFDNIYDAIDPINPRLNVLE